jgi:hypothetical protein
MLRDLLIEESCAHTVHPDRVADPFNMAWIVNHRERQRVVDGTVQESKIGHRLDRVMYEAAPQ